MILDFLKGWKDNLILKLIALFFMLIDHLGAVVFPSVTEMRILGRIAFPIYCWCMVVGFYYTRSVPKYLGRILLTGVLVQPLYAYVMNHVGSTGNLLADLYLPYPNIFLTLFQLLPLCGADDVIGGPPAQVKEVFPVSGRAACSDLPDIRPPVLSHGQGEIHFLRASDQL